MPTIDINKLVGAVAGAIYTGINERFPFPPLMLVPALTFKVKKVLQHIGNTGQLSDEDKAEVARSIQVAIVPMLFSYEIDVDVIQQITPVIESASYSALKQLINA
jgi:hypothetical protein